MANGIFLGTSVIDGVPTLFQYTARPDTPVVIVERYKPTKEDLVPRPVSFDGIEIAGYSNTPKCDPAGNVKGYAPNPEIWDEAVKEKVKTFLASPDTARRLVERVTEDAVVKINPLNYPEPLRQKLLSTPHLEKGDPDAQS